MPVYFPYAYIYPEQYEYMLSLKRALDAGGPVCLEMPTGTGKTVSLLSLIISYKLWRPEMGKLIYCCRTVGEISKTVEELREVIRFIEESSPIPPSSFLALALSSRKNLCIHPEVSTNDTRDTVDSACRAMTAPWIRDRAEENSDIELCDFYEGFERFKDDINLSGIFSLEDIKTYGNQKGICPYFMARYVVNRASVIIYSYQYLLNPRISEIVSKEFKEDSIVVFDEAHNIDDVCIEALSINIDKKIMETSLRNVSQLDQLVRETKKKDAEKLKEEYQRLLQGIQQSAIINDPTRPSPVLPDDAAKEAVPEEIRLAEEFMTSLRKFVDFTNRMLRVPQVTSLLPATFLKSTFDATKIDHKVLKFYTSRLNSLLRTLEITDLDRYTSLSTICDFATLVATYEDGFRIIIEPYDDRTPNIPDPLLQFACLDASIAIQPVMMKFGRVIITSGTLSPITMLPNILRFQPVLSKSLTTTLFRQNVQPLVISRGSDQTFLSTKFKDRENMDILRNYGLLLLKMCEVIPDGIVAFFTSYSYLESIISVWNSMGLLNQILKHKLLFVETSDFAATSIALVNYKLACENGRGAVFLSVARGKVSEGIDFANHYGRCVILFGIPYVYTESRKLKARLEFLKKKYQIEESDFLTFDAMRTAAQCVGRVIRGKSDYGLMIFADNRYNRIDKRSKLPPWITQFLNHSNLNLSTDVALALANTFLREIAQPVDKKDQIGVSLWTLKDVEQQPTSQPPPT